LRRFEETTMTRTFKIGDRVRLAYQTKSNLTYGYVREVNADGTMTVYFPEIRSEGSGWVAADFR
jgi:hypothetical protein